MADHRDADLALSEFWNDLTAGRAGAPDGIDPATAAAVRRLHTLASKPLSDSARERVWRGLMASTDQTTSDKERPMTSIVTLPRSVPLSGPNGQYPPPLAVLPALRTTRNRFALPLAAAIVLLMLVAGWWLLGMPWLERGEQHAAIPAPLLPPAATPSPAVTPAARVSTFRGDFARTGINPGPGPAGKPAVRWQVDTASPLWGSPTVVNGVVYANENGGVLVALEATTGAERWRFDAPSFSHASPTVVDGVVYAGFRDGKLRAFDAATGAVIWELDAGLTIPATPAVVDGVVYIGTGIESTAGDLIAADAATGHERWRLHLDSSAFASPAVVNGVVYVGTGKPGVNGTVYAVDAASGKQLWTFPTGYDFGDVVVVDGVLYVAAEDGVYAIDTATGTQRWHVAPDPNEPFDTAPAVAKGVVYAASTGGYLVALDAATGAEHWRADLGPAESSNSSPTVADGVVYIGSDGSVLHAIDAATGTEHWHMALPVTHDIWGSPTVLDGVIYLGTGGFESSGTLFALGDPLPATPVAGTSVASPVAQTCGATTANTSAPAVSPVPVALSVATPVAGTPPAVAFTWAIDGSVAGASKVGNLAIDPQCRLWVVDVSNNRFLIYDLDGNLLETWGSQGHGDGQFEFAQNGFYGGVAFAPDGGFYVVDVGNQRIQQFAADRGFVRSWTASDDSGKAVAPGWIAVGPDGDVYVSVIAQTRAIQVFTPDGQFVRAFGSPLNGDDALGAIAFDPAGNTWVQVPSLSSLLEFSPTGQQMTQLDLSSRVSAFPFGLAIDAAGRFYIVDGGSGKVAVFDPSGNFLFSWGEFGRNAGQLNNPWWIALDGSGGVYVAQQNQSRVQRFQVQP